MMGLGSYNPRRQARIIERRYLESARRLSTMIPGEQLSLQQLAAGARRVRLLNGEVHEISDDEASRLLEAVPQYFWRHMRVPIMLRYVKSGDGGSRYEVQGDVWQRRLVEIMLTGSYSVSGLSEISVSDFKKIVARYPSIVFVSLTL